MKSNGGNCEKLDSPRRSITTTTIIIISLFVSTRLSSTFKNITPTQKNAHIFYKHKAKHHSQSPITLVDHSIPPQLSPLVFDQRYI